MAQLPDSVGKNVPFYFNDSYIHPSIVRLLHLYMHKKARLFLLQIASESPAIISTIADLLVFMKHS